MLNVLFPFVISIYVSRILGPSGVGRVAYAHSILSYFLVFASVGIPTYGIRVIARNTNNREKLNKRFSELIIINSIATTAAIIIYLSMLFSVEKFSAERMLFLVVGINLFFNYINIDWFFSGCEDYVYITVRSTLFKLVAIVLIFVFVREKDDVLIYAFIGQLGVCANYIFNVFRLKNRVKLDFRQLDINQHIKPAVVLLFTILASDLYNQIDVTMLGWISTNEEVGCYSYAIKLVRIVTSVATAIAVTVLPRLSQYYNEKEIIQFNELSQKTVKAVLMVAMPCAAGLAICSKEIITILYGESFLRSSEIIDILLPIVIIISVSYFCGSVVLTAINKEKYLLVATISGAIVNIALNTYLIPRWEGNGAAVASVFAEIIVLIIHVFIATKYVRFKFFCKDNIVTVASSIIMSATVYITNAYLENSIMGLIITILIGIAVYSCMMITLKHEITIMIITRIGHKTKRER